MEIAESYGYTPLYLSLCIFLLYIVFMLPALPLRADKPLQITAPSVEEQLLERMQRIVTLLLKRSEAETLVHSEMQNISANTDRILASIQLLVDGQAAMTEKQGGASGPAAVALQSENSKLRAHVQELEAKVVHFRNECNTLRATAQSNAESEAIAVARVQVVEQQLRVREEAEETLEREKNHTEAELARLQRELDELQHRQREIDEEHRSQLQNIAMEMEDKRARELQATCAKYESEIKLRQEELESDKLREHVQEQMVLQQKEADMRIRILQEEQARRNQAYQEEVDGLRERVQEEEGLRLDRESELKLLKDEVGKLRERVQAEERWKLQREMEVKSLEEEVRVLRERYRAVEKLRVKSGTEANADGGSLEGQVPTTVTDHTKKARGKENVEQRGGEAEKHPNAQALAAAGNMPLPDSDQDLQPGLESTL